jgi:hypothetical protein
MLHDLLRIGGELTLVSNAAIVIDHAEIDSAGRDIQPNIMAFRHTESSRIKDRHVS